MPASQRRPGPDAPTGSSPGSAAGRAVDGQLRRLSKAFLFSLAGLRDAWREPACRLEIYAVVLAVPVALWLPLTTVERLLLIGSVVALFVVELLNTSVEAAIDRIGPERHELSRVAKDIGSAAVFVAALMAGVVWIAVAGPAIVALAG